MLSTERAAGSSLAAARRPHRRAVEDGLDSACTPRRRQVVDNVARLIAHTPLNRFIVRISIVRIVAGGFIDMMSWSCIARTRYETYGHC